MTSNRLKKLDELRLNGRKNMSKLTNHVAYFQGCPDWGGVGGVTPPQSWKIFGFSQPKRKFFLRSVRKNFYILLKNFLHPPKFFSPSKKILHPPNVPCLGPPLLISLRFCLVYPTSMTARYTFVCSKDHAYLFEE